MTRDEDWPLWKEPQPPTVVVIRIAAMDAIDRAVRRAHVRSTRVVEYFESERPLSKRAKRRARGKVKR